MKKRIIKLLAAVSLCTAVKLTATPGAFGALCLGLRELGSSGAVTAFIFPQDADADAPLCAESSLPAEAADYSAIELSAESAAPQPKKRALPRKPAAPPAVPSVTDKSGLDPDLAALLAAPLPFTLPRDAAQILILHTHGSEAYSQEGGAYEETDRSRTSDKTKSVVRVGDVLADSFGAAGFHVLHDRELYDYPSYSGSYSRSLEAAQRYLSDYPTIKAVFDIHRDALYAPDGSAVRRVCTLPDGTECAKIMIIAATGANGLYFDTWRDNLSFALKIQALLEQRCPGLAEPLLITGERYNEHAAPGYLLVEIGTDGNTLAEAERAAEIFAECVSSVLADAVDAGGAF